MAFNQDIKKFLDAQGVSTLWAKVNAKVEAEATRAKAAEAANAAAAKKAQDDVNALSTYVGAIPETYTESSIVAFITFGDVCFNNNLFVRKTGNFLSSFCSIDEVKVISRLFIVQADKADFEVFGNGVVCLQNNLIDRCFGKSRVITAILLVSAACKAEKHCYCKKKCE